jgi:hypothetical protein
MKRWSLLDRDRGNRISRYEFDRRDQQLRRAVTGRLDIAQPSQRQPFHDACPGRDT